MTDMEKKIMLRLCAKVIEYVDFETDPEAERLVNWVILDNQRKQNNNEIRSLTAQYKKSEPQRRESISAAHQQGKDISSRRAELYERQPHIQ